ncbi:glycosyltransferase family protein [Portibacter marinus]|uniref:hypothetical protein n=1 Tax=Portibacter marinus TaxID=2898660 RepID=UPI001F43F667|nr:hypothetical protein [Portibacter marinus]
MANTIKIVIPGTINQYRNYGNLIDGIQEYSKRSDRKMEIVLLGRNHSGIDFQVYNTDQLSFHTFNDYVTEDKYLQEIQNADLMILPLEEYIEYKGVLEIKGSSNISGGINDAAFVGCPIIIPEFYRHGYLEKYINYFRDESSLINQIGNVLNDINARHKMNGTLTYNKMATVWNTEQILKLGADETNS